MPVEPRKILMVAPEAAPFVKVGGLADVVGSLSKALSHRGHDVRIVIPRYAGLREAEAARVLENPVLILRLGGHEAYARVWECPFRGASAKVYFLEYNRYFDSPSVYGGPTGDEGLNGYRFGLLSRASIDLCHHLGWTPDVFHCHDWTTGLVPVFLNTTERDGPLGRAASVMTIHNLQHQGWFDRGILDYVGLPGSVFRTDGLESMGEANLLKGGLYHATKLTTVSRTYAGEIQEPDGGCGLHHVLRYRSADLVGVINGIDVEEWDPGADPLIPAHFNRRNLAGKADCKAALQAAYGLEIAPDRPVFTVVSRLFDQKGLDLLAAIGDRLMKEMQLQVAVLGTGDPGLEAAFAELARRYPGRFAAHLGFDNELAHLSVAGADFLVMPSRFEPCGLSQMYAMRYGTLPVVRETGGLVDTVEQYIEGEGIGTGFRFHYATAGALFDTMGWACATYYDRPKELGKLRSNAMRRDFTWDRSAGVYEDVYGWAMDARAAAFG